MFKRIEVVLASFLAVFLFTARASALSLSSLEQVSEPSESIEINDPEDGYDFGANFLAKNQELVYKATVINDEGLPIKITDINLNSSEYDFLEYSYDGIAINDTLESGETKDITIRVATNSNDTQTVAEDYNLAINYSKINPPTPDNPDNPDDPGEPEEETTDNPETATTAVVKTTTLTAVCLGLILIVFVRNKKIRNLAIVFTISSLGLYFLCPNVYAEETSSFNIVGKIYFTNIYKVTVDPNGGVYKNKTENTIAYRREGQSYHVSEATREHFEFVEWEVNPGDLDENNDIEIHADTTIKAKWDENTYTLTIKPEGGEYLGSTEEWSESFRPNETATVAVPEKEGYNFTHWTVEEGNVGEGGSFSGSSITMTEDVTLVANYEIKKFTVTVIPNGGVYHDSTNTFTKTVDWNTDYEIESISREGYDLKDWTKTVGNNSTTIAADTQSVNIKADTVLEANWWSSTFHTVTIIPNGGIYDESTEASEYQVREGETYTMLEATSSNAIFSYWHYTDTETRFSESEFVVTEDVSLTAEWLPIVARIERTQKVYPSIMAAHAEANPEGYTNDTITLLVDTDEVVTISKEVTLDLNTHTVYGYLTNTTSGNLRLINGVIDNCTKPTLSTAATCDNTISGENNPHGAAIINNGTLTLGYDDYTGDKNASEAAIDHDYIRLFGDEYGIEQNGTLNYYDGSIEAQFGLIGGYDSSPWFRKMSDGKDIYYFPFVSKNNIKNCQHVQLESSNLAVSKTIDNGEIYYYNLQDNINTSAITGYKIYAIRDFEASYPITVAHGDTIDFDIVGYDIDLGDDWTNNGVFNISDSKSADETGALNFSRTFVNNSALTLTNVKLTATSPNNLISNVGNLTLAGSEVHSDTSSAIELTGENSVINADNNSTISTSNSNYSAVLNNATKATIYGGNYSGTNTTIKNNTGKQLIIEGGAYTTNTTSGASIFVNNGTLDFNNGSINYENTDTLTYINGIKNDGNSANTTVNGGNINIKAKGSVYGIYASSGTLTVNTGDITVESTESQAFGIYGSSNSTTIQKGENATKAPSITVTSYAEACGILFAKDVSDVTIIATSYDYPSACGISNAKTVSNVDVTATNDSYNAYGVRNIDEFNSGTVSASSKNGTAYGMSASSGTLKGGTITATSDNGTAVGYYGNGSSNDWYSSKITGGTVTGAVKNSDHYGYGILANRYHTTTVTGGNITGTNFGLNSEGSDRVVTIGDSTDAITKDAPIISGGDYGVNASIIDFYDGTLIGGTDYLVDHSKIRTIPSGSDYHIEEIDNKQNCWLVTASDWLYNARLDKSYNSFEAAYNDELFQEGDTLEVTRDYSTESLHANNTHTVTLDLKNHTLNFTQSIPNSGKMAIKNGKITNQNVSAYTINNSGELTIDKSEINGSCSAIYSHENNNKLTISNNSLLALNEQSKNCYGVIHLHRTTTEINDSTIQVDGTTYSYTYGIYFDYSGGSLDINRSTIHVTSTSSSAFGISANGVQEINFNSGSIYAFSGSDKDDSSTYKDSAYGIIYASKINFGTENSTNNETPLLTVIGSSSCGLSCSTSGVTNVYSGTINATANSGASYGVQTMTLNNYGGIVNAYANSGTSYGEQSSYKFKMLSGEVSSNSISGKSYGVKASEIDIKDGSISATKGADNTKDATGIEANVGSITGGTIYGKTYGLNDSAPTSSQVITLGTDDGTLNKDAFTITGGEYGINNGYIYFNDGTLVGKADLDYAKDRNSIKAIPAGASYQYEVTSDEYKCWLVSGTEFLYNPRLDSRYASFSAAYDDENFQSGDTLQVIDNATHESIIPNNEKNVILDLNGKTLTISQSIPNSGTLTITDSKGNGILQTNNVSDSTPVISNSGTLNIESGTISGLVNTISTSGTYTQTGGTVKVSGASAKVAIATYQGTVNITNGIVISENQTNTLDNDLSAIRASAATVTITDSDITAYNKNGSVYGIKQEGGYSYSRFNIYGNSKLTVESATSSATGVEYGIVNTAKNNSGSPTITVKTTNGSAEAIDASSTSSEGDESIIADTTITVTNDNSVAYGIEYANEAKNNTINITSNNSSAYGLLSVKKASLNDITVTANNTAYGISCRECTIESGVTTVSSQTANAYGYYSNTDYDDQGDITISGGSVSATTEGDGKLAYGYYQGTHAKTLITGGSISGQHYGIYSANSSGDYIMTIGNDDGTIYNGVDNPSIQPLISGGVYGLYGGYVNFYDGRIRGGTTATFDRNIKAIATNSYMHMTQETDYDEVKYVSETEMLAKIGDGACDTVGTTCYPTLQAAIDAAQTDDTVTLLKDNYVFSTLNVSTEKTLTIELDGFIIVPTAHFTNAGNVTIQDSTSTRPVLDYHESDYFFENTGTLTFKNVDIKADHFVNNASGASLTLDNTKVTFEAHSNTADKYMITNAGTVALNNNSLLTTERSAISQSEGQLTINNSEIKYDSENPDADNYYLVNATSGKVILNKGKLSTTDTTSYSNRTKRLIYQGNDVETEITNASVLTNGKLEINSGNLTMKDSSLTNNHTSSSQTISIGTNADVSFDNCQLSLAVYPEDNQGSISNEGKLALTNNSEAKVMPTLAGTAGRKATVIYNKGDLVIDGSKITLDTTTAPTSDSSKKYGIYNSGADSIVHIQNGSQISVSTSGTGASYGVYVETSGTASDKGVFLGDTSFIKASAPKAYGVYVDNGKFVMGEKETDPLHIGEDIASKTDPSVEGISTTSDSNSLGYGVVHVQGIFDFYDGKITGSTHSRSATITEVEYLYQAKEEIDANNHEVTILQYMPNPSNQGGQ